MRRLKWVGCFCLLLLVSRSSAEELPGELKIDFLGLHLGCTEAEAVAVVNKGPLFSSFSEQAIERRIEGDEIHCRFSGNHRLQGFTATVLVFWKNRLRMVVIATRTEDGILYDALKLKLEKRYGKMEDDVCFGGKSSSKTVDGMYLNIKHKKVLFESDHVILGAGHCMLSVAREADKIKQKGDETGDF